MIEKNFLNRGHFTLHSGLQTWFKIDCDGLTEESEETLVELMWQCVKIKPSCVVPIPTGGDSLANRMMPVILRDGGFDPDGPVIIVDDVLTTGTSFEKAREDIGTDNVIGIVGFARGPVPAWVIPVFSLNDRIGGFNG